MRTKARKKRKKSIGAALLVGLIFGICLVTAQELFYQYRLMNRYESGEGNISFIRLEPVIAVAEDPPAEPEEILPEPEPEITVPTGLPARYDYDAATGDTLIHVDDFEIVLNFAELHAINADFIGWLVIPGADLSFPVVQGTDNDYYLKHAFEGNYSNPGAIFADWRNDILNDENTIIYGHNWRNYAIMFSKLVCYADQAFFDEYPVAYFLTDDGGCRIDFFSAYETPTSDPVYTLTYANGELYAEALEHLKEMSAIRSDVEVTADDKLVTLSTCSNLHSDGRFVVIGKIEPFRIPAEETVGGKT